MLWLSHGFVAIVLNEPMKLTETYKPFARSASMLPNFAGEMLLVKLLSECQTAWIRMRHRVARRLILIQAVCIWDYSRDWRSKG